MSRLFMLLPLLALSACDNHTYRCSPEQMERVESETLFCKTNTNISDASCYYNALERNCEYVPLPEKKL